MSLITLRRCVCFALTWCKGRRNFKKGRKTLLFNIFELNCGNAAYQKIKISAEGGQRLMRVCVGVCMQALPLNVCVCASLPVCEETTLMN